MAYPPLPTPLCGTLRFEIAAIRITAISVAISSLLKVFNKATQLRFRWRSATSNRAIIAIAQLCYRQETLTLRFRSCFLNFGTYGLALVNQIFDSDFCLAVCLYEWRLQTTNPLFQNHELTRIKLRIHSAKLRKGAWLQPEPHFKITNPNFPTMKRDFQTTIGGPRPGIFRLRTDQKSCYETKIRVGKEQPRNYEAHGRTVRCVFRDIGASTQASFVVAFEKV